MSDIPYDKYAEWVQNAPVQRISQLVDIGCGTGVLTCAICKSRI